VEISNIQIHAMIYIKAASPSALSDLADQDPCRLDWDDNQTAYSSGGTLRR
jgi:hypothetical protein